MKRTFTLIAALIFSLSLFAQTNQAQGRPGSYQSRLTVSTIAKYPVKLVIDGRTYNDRSNRDNDIVIRDIRPGYHTIKIYQQKNNGFSVRRLPNNNPQLVYSGNLYIKPQYHVDITINRFGKAYIDEMAINAGYYNDDDDNDHNWNNNDHYNMQPMNATAFEQFRQTVSNSSFEDTKLAIAKQTIDANYFTSAQVTNILQLFNYESGRLEIAKYAYKKSTDKTNYFLVSNALTYSSSKEELARYLQTVR